MIKNNPPKGEPFVWLTEGLLRSDSWRSLDLYARRFIDFLLLEHLRRAGQANGKLRAPYRQLYAFRIWRRYAPTAIARAEELGLVACHRGGMRAASEYRLTWLPTHDGKAATDEWRAFRNPDLSPHVRYSAGKKSEICTQGVGTGLDLTCGDSCPQGVGTDEPDLCLTPGYSVCGSGVGALLRDSSTGERSGERGAASAPATGPSSKVVPLRPRRRSHHRPKSHPGTDHHH